jgi:hypothetical protein
MSYVERPFLDGWMDCNTKIFKDTILHICTSLGNHAFSRYSYVLIIHCDFKKTAGFL